MTCRRRPYRVECTGSLSTSEVKQYRARSVLGWGTAWEDLRVLSAFRKILCRSCLAAPSSTRQNYTRALHQMPRVDPSSSSETCVGSNPAAVIPGSGCLRLRDELTRNVFPLPHSYRQVPGLFGRHIAATLRRHDNHWSFNECIVCCYQIHEAWVP